jgi:hypothetical protein
MQLRSPRRCKEMPVIPVNKVVDPKRIIGKKWRAKEEERHKGSLTTPPKKKKLVCVTDLQLRAIVRPHRSLPAKFPTLSGT